MLHPTDLNLRLAAGMMPGAVWILRSDGCVAWSNAKAGGFAGDVVDGRRFDELVHPADRIDLERWWSNRDVATVAVRIRIHPVGDDMRWHLLQLAPWTSDEWIVTATDVDPQFALVETLKRDAEELEQDIFTRLHELNQNRARLQTIFDACPDYLYVLRLDKAGGVSLEDLNLAAEELFGGKRSDVIGRSMGQGIGQGIGDVPGIGGTDDVETQVRRALRGGRVDHCMTVAVGAKIDRTIQVVAAPLAYSNEEEGLVLFCGRDITEQRAAEEALRQSQKMEAVGQLTGGLAHDFNNMLTGIMGSLDLLGMRIARGEFDRVERYITVAQEGAARAAALTHRLLAFSRRQTLDPRPLDANRLISGMDDLLRRTGGPSISVSFDLAGDLWTVLADPSQLENALLNLCINARDAMPDGGTIGIETRNARLDGAEAGDRDLPAGDYVTLSVSDDGVGMPPDVAARIFDPFFTTKPIGMGTGLGLSMIFGFAKQSGGNVRVHTRPGLGTTMRILLPRIEGEAAEEDPGTTQSAPRAKTGEAALVVDDEHAIRSLAAETLANLGYDVTVAGDGVEGLDRLRSDRRFDALITDVGMPGGLNGRQFAEAARGLRPGIKVLFITGYAENAVLNHAHLGTGARVLTKPFAMEALGTCLRSLLDAP